MCLITIKSIAAIKTLKIQNGRYVSYETNSVGQNEKPTLILLPTLLRGWTENDEFVKILKKENINFVTIHYSLQPESILKIPKTELPYVTANSYQISDLSSEVEHVIRKLNLKQPIIVGTNYSSVVTTEFAQNRKYSPILNVAPMIRFDESTPSGGPLTDFWINFFNLNPISGTIITKWYLKQTYTQYWSEIVDQLILSNSNFQNKQIRETLIASYTEMSMMIHGFDFINQDFSNGIVRLFILGGNEDHPRYNSQIEAISKYQRDSGQNHTTVVIPQAGHLLPTDNPREFVRILKTLIK